jgi:hypothetical protein
MKIPACPSNRTPQFQHHPAISGDLGPNGERRRSFLASGASGLLAVVTLGLLCWPAPRTAAEQLVRPQGTVIVRPALGGTIIGYDIDQNGSEGLLTEYVPGAGGMDTVAAETFNQLTGKITSIVARMNQTKSDYVTLGIVGSHVGLVEFEHVSKLYVDARRYYVIDPLNANKFTGMWRPALLGKNDIIEEVSANQGMPNNAVFGLRNDENFYTLVFQTNVAANTFGPLFVITEPIFAYYNSPVMAYDSRNNQAVLASSTGSPQSVPELATVNLATGAMNEFTGLGLGFVNGIGYDSNTGIACTTTEIDFSVEFYNIAQQTGFIETLPNATNQIQSGAAVAVDPIHKLFLVEQPYTSTGKSGSAIQEYNEAGRFITSINGLQLPVSPTRIALHPSARFGFVLQGQSELQSFDY